MTPDEARALAKEATIYGVRAVARRVKGWRPSRKGSRWLTRAATELRFTAEISTIGCSDIFQSLGAGKVDRYRRASGKEPFSLKHIQFCKQVYSSVNTARAG